MKTTSSHNTHFERVPMKSAHGATKIFFVALWVLGGALLVALSSHDVVAQSPETTKRTTQSPPLSRSAHASTIPQNPNHSHASAIDDAIVASDRGWKGSAFSLYMSPEKRKELKRRATIGDAQAQYELALFFTATEMDGMLSKNLELTSIDYFRMAAEQGHAKAQYELALIYYCAAWPETDFEKAAKWFRASAQQGIPHAQYDLAKCYLDGTGVAKNKTEAVKWYRKAAKQGLANAQYKLASILLEDEKDSAHLAEGMKWLRMAAEQGLPKVQYELGTRLCYGKGIRENKAEALKWFRKAAEQDFVSAIYEISSCYRYGHGVVANKQEALRWIRKAAERGHVHAQYELGDFYNDKQTMEEFGVKGKVDKTEALKWFRKAAEQGHGEAQFKLGCAYIDGTGIKKDYQEGVKWLRATWEMEWKNMEPGLGANASKSSLQTAAAILGECYEKGLGVCVDREEAIRWYGTSGSMHNEDSAAKERRLKREDFHLHNEKTRAIDKRADTVP